MGIERTKLAKTAKLIAERLNGKTYAIRGTTSLVLQGLNMVVEDIDIVCDDKTALFCNRIFADFIIEKVDYKESPKFKSYFGKFNIDGVLVEIMGNWQIKDTKDSWAGPFCGDTSESVEITVDGKQIPVTRIETELKAYALMGRWNAYHKIKRQYDQNKGGTGQQNLFVS